MDNIDSWTLEITDLLINKLKSSKHKISVLEGTISMTDTEDNLLLLLILSGDKVIMTNKNYRSIIDFNHDYDVANKVWSMIIDSLKIN
jgi:hypothetical protein